MAESDPALVQTSDDAATANVRVASLENRLGEPDRLAHLEARVAANEQQHADREKAWQASVTAVREIFEARLDAMDKATELLSETVNRVPTETQREVGNLRNVVAEQFRSVDKQFAERDIRSEREARDNRTAVDAAFAAQKEAAAEQNKANTTAINKSEAATAETIGKLAELFESRTEGLREQLNDLKLAQRALESGRSGATEGRVERRADRAIGSNMLAVVVSSIVGTAVVIGVVIGIVAAIHG